MASEQRLEARNITTATTVPAKLQCLLFGEDLTLLPSSFPPSSFKTQTQNRKRTVSVSSSCGSASDFFQYDSDAENLECLGPKCTSTFSDSESDNDADEMEIGACEEFVPLPLGKTNPFSSLGRLTLAEAWASAASSPSPGEGAGGGEEGGGECEGAAMRGGEESGNDMEDEAPVQPRSSEGGGASFASGWVEVLDVDFGVVAEVSPRGEGKDVSKRCDNDFEMVGGGDDAVE